MGGKPNFAYIIFHLGKGEIRFGERGDTGFIIPAFVAWGDAGAVVPIG